ncbi:MAG: hypothetical protein AAGC93_22130 [Cyanobacteria bacterium P01_F01_bin.53]
MLIIVIGLNSLLALGVCWLTHGLWQWRRGLINFNSWLQSAQQSSQDKPQQMGYDLIVKRAQIAQTRLDLARWRLRSRRLHQVIQLISLFRSLLLYRRIGLFKLGRSTQKGFSGKR